MRSLFYTDKHVLTNSSVKCHSTKKAMQSIFQRSPVKEVVLLSDNEKPPISIDGSLDCVIKLQLRLQRDLRDRLY